MNGSETGWLQAGPGRRVGELLAWRSVAHLTAEDQRNRVVHLSGGHVPDTEGTDTVLLGGGDCA